MSVGALEEQSRREFASTDEAAGTENAALQKRWLGSEIPLNTCRRLQHFQRPTSSHVSPNAPHASRGGDEHVAGSDRGRLRLPVTRRFTSSAWQRDDAIALHCERKARRRRLEPNLNFGRAQARSLHSAAGVRMRRFVESGGGRR
jgi:hypothetical protein